MKIRDIGLGAGLLLGGGLTFIGGFAMTFHTPSDNTGIMLVLGRCVSYPRHYYFMHNFVQLARGKAIQFI